MIDLTQILFWGATATIIYGIIAVAVALQTILTSRYTNYRLRYNKSFEQTRNTVPRRKLLEEVLKYITEGNRLSADAFKNNAELVSILVELKGALLELRHEWREQTYLISATSDLKDMFSELRKEFKDLEELKKERKIQIDDLLHDAIRLIRSRFEYANPDDNLRKQMMVFSIKMDAIPTRILLEDIGADPTGTQNWRYGEIFLRRGIVAYYDDDPAKARDMLKIAETFFPLLEEQLFSISSEQRLATALTRYYLALIEMNYGDIRQAQNYIENSYIVWGKNIENELLIPITRAEIFSYAPGGIDRAREAIAEILERVKILKKSGGSLTKHEVTCVAKAYLLLGNTYYLEMEWEEALRSYQSALNEDREGMLSYYAFYAIAQTLRKLSQEFKAEKIMEEAYQHLRRSYQPVHQMPLEFRISLNALAYKFSQSKNPKEARQYREAILNDWLNVQRIGDLELRIFSLEQKRPIGRDEFWKEFFGDIEK